MKRFLRDLLRSPWLQRALGVLAAEYLRLVWRTTRFSYDPANVYDMVEPAQPAIFAFWHGQHFMTPFIKNKASYRAKVLISLHRDGEYNAIAAERLGIEYRKIDEMDLATAPLEYSVWAMPDNTALRMRLARLYVRYHRPDLALTQVERILELNPNHAEARRLHEELKVGHS